MHSLVVRLLVLRASLAAHVTTWATSEKAALRLWLTLLPIPIVDKARLHPTDHSAAIGDTTFSDGRLLFDAQLPTSSR